MLRLLHLLAVNHSYKQEFPDRKFNNLRQGTLAGQVNMVDVSRHKQLIERAKKKPVVGLYFPNPLQGFSVDASREQMNDLPEGFYLSGLDTVIAMIMYPDILARDVKIPGLYLTALQYKSPEYYLYFKANDDKLSFGATDYLSVAGGSYSGGLSFLR